MCVNDLEYIARKRNDKRCMKVCYSEWPLCALYSLAWDSIIHDPLVLTFLSIVGADLMLYNMYFCKLWQIDKNKTILFLYSKFLYSFCCYLNVHQISAQKKTEITK